MKMRLKLALAIIPLGVIIAAVPANKTKPYKLSAKQMIEEVNSNSQFMSPDMIADMIIGKDPSLQLIDVRSKDDYDTYHLPGAVNIPLTDILSEDYEPIINQNVKMNVFYSTGSTKANEAWMIVRQLGYQNNYVLQGGMNYWAETILSPKAPASTLPDDEIAKYDFRKAASGALGGGSLETNEAPAATAPIPIIKKQSSKKRVAGGC